MKGTRRRTATPEVQHTRPPLERMLRIHQALQAGNFPNANTLSMELEVCSKSIHRDIDFMRDRLNLPIEYHPQKFGYHYTGEVTEFPALQISEGEIFALIVAEKALQQYRGTSFEKPLVSALRKLEQALPNTISISLEEVSQTISFRTRAEPILDLGTFETLAKATADRKQLELTYRKPGQQQTECRVVDPYHFANINGEWYLFAFDHLRNDIRTFVPARIKAIRETGKTFQREEKFSVEERLRGSFGVHSDQGEFDVVIRFNEKVADYIREKKWHDSQQLKELKGGAVELRMKLSSLPEVERWVLGWGGNATIVNPPQLAEMVRDAAQKILQNGSK